eukprot:m.29766 g.29766  ORF g.29766 m.29766 type:complete len:1161 (+) comp6181_c1_seq1:84-3566(+)
MVDWFSIFLVVVTAELLFLGVNAKAPCFLDLHGLVVGGVFDATLQNCTTVFLRSKCNAYILSPRKTLTVTIQKEVSNISFVSSPSTSTPVICNAFDLVVVVEVPDVEGKISVEHSSNDAMNSPSITFQTIPGQALGVQTLDLKLACSDVIFPSMYRVGVVNSDLDPAISIKKVVNGKCGTKKYLVKINNNNDNRTPLAIHRPLSVEGGVLVANDVVFVFGGVFLDIATVQLSDGVQLDDADSSGTHLWPQMELKGNIIMRGPTSQLKLHGLASVVGALIKMDSATSVSINGYTNNFSTNLQIPPCHSVGIMAGTNSECRCFSSWTSGSSCEDLSFPFLCLQNSPNPNLIGSFSSVDSSSVKYLLGDDYSLDTDMFPLAFVKADVVDSSISYIMAPSSQNVWSIFRYTSEEVTELYRSGVKSSFSITAPPRTAWYSASELEKNNVQPSASYSANYVAKTSLFPTPQMSCPSLCSFCDPGDLQFCQDSNGQCTDFDTDGFCGIPCTESKTCLSGWKERASNEQTKCEGKIATTTQTPATTTNNQGSFNTKSENSKKIGIAISIGIVAAICIIGIVVLTLKWKGTRSPGYTSVKPMVIPPENSVDNSDMVVNPTYNKYTIGRNCDTSSTMDKNSSAPSGRMVILSHELLSNTSSSFSVTEETPNSSHYDNKTSFNQAHSTYDNVSNASPYVSHYNNKTSLNRAQDSTYDNAPNARVMLKKRASGEYTKMNSVDNNAYDMRGSGVFFDAVAEVWQYPCEKLSLGPILGEGHFGAVYKAEAPGIVKDSNISTIAVKLLKGTASSADELDFARELELMMSIESHPNLVAFLGVCTVDGAKCILVEFMSNGNLRDYLRAAHAKMSETSSRLALSNNQLLSFCRDVAVGMEFLSSLNIVHRDLAARNILVNSALTAKIADFGLARDVGQDEGEYAVVNKLRMMPLKWMSPESLDPQRRTFTTKSDVWSFGVCLFEIASLGQSPYGKTRAVEVARDILLDDFRMPKPPECSKEYYSVMLKCWTMDAMERPSFSDVVEMVTLLLKHPAAHLIYDESDTFNNLETPSDPTYVTRKDLMLDDDDASEGMEFDAQSKQWEREVSFRFEKNGTDVDVALHSKLNTIRKSRISSSDYAMPSILMQSNNESLYAQSQTVVNSPLYSTLAAALKMDN